MPRRKRSSDAEFQRALIRELEAEIKALYSPNFLRLLLHAYGVHGGLQTEVDRLAAVFLERARALDDVYQRELSQHARLHELLDLPQREVPDFGTLEELRRPVRRAARSRRGGIAEGDIDLRLVKPAKRAASRSPSRMQVELKYPDHWGSDPCDPSNGCTSVSKTLHTHAAVIREIEARLAEAEELRSAWAPVLDEYPFLASKPEILDFLDETLDCEWGDILTLLEHRCRKKPLPIKERYLAKVTASARTMVSKFRKGQLPAKRRPARK